MLRLCSSCVRAGPPQSASDPDRSPPPTERSSLWGEAEGRTSTTTSRHIRLETGSRRLSRRPVVHVGVELKRLPQRLRLPLNARPLLLRESVPVAQALFLIHQGLLRH